MAKTPELVTTLKRALKDHGLTYTDVANTLDMSLANVKRMFSERHFTLRRIDAICGMMEMDFLDLLHLYEQSLHRISRLTLDQEQELAADIKLLLTAVCVRNYFSFDDIIRIYDINETDCISCLVKLDKLGLIELLPKNRIKLKIEENFRWLPGGPIEKYFEQYVQPDFLNASFSDEHAHRLFLTGMLSRSSQDYILKKTNDLAKEFAHLLRQDSGLSINEKTNVGLILAQRPWELTELKALHRKSGNNNQ